MNYRGESFFVGLVLEKSIFGKKYFDMKRIISLLVLFLFMIQGIYAQNGQLERTTNVVNHGETSVFEQNNLSKTSLDWEMDFEDVDDFSLEFTPWTVIDGDLGQTYGITDVSFPHNEDPMAFIAFNPAATTPSLGGDAALQPHTGLRFGACFSSVAPKTNDDWIISPKLILGSNSSISFFVKSYTSQYGLEEYTVAVSSTGNEIADFNAITDVLLAPAAEWTHKVIDLTDFDHDTVYIAIHCVSEDHFIFMVDDIIVNTTLGITNQDAVKVKVFPNPVSETVFVEAEQTIENIEITDNSGRLLITKNYNDRNASLDISELANGIYFLRLTTNKGSAVRKIQKR